MRTDPEIIEMLSRRGVSPVSTVQGHEMADKIGAVGYFETSAMTQYGLKQLFDTVIHKGIVNKSPKRGKKSLSVFGWIRKAIMI